MNRKAVTEKRWYTWLAIFLLVCQTFVYTEAVYADSQVILSETSLDFRGLLTEPLQRSFTLKVKGDPISNVRILRHDLLDKDTGAVILSNNIVIDPLERDTITDQENFQVTLSGATRPGHYKGSLEILYEGLPIDTPLTIDVNVILEAVPLVDAEVNSKSLSFFVQQFWGMPFAKPKADAQSPVLAEEAIFLMQNTQGNAEIQEAKVLAMRGPKGESLPVEAIKVTSNFPFTLTNNDAASIQVAVAGQNLRAGEYNGTLVVRVRNQPALVQIPTKVQIKDGWLLPMIVLAGGLLLGFVLHWWKEDGLATRSLVRKIEALANEVRPGNKLQAADRDRAMSLLKAAVTLVNTGAPPAEIQAKYDETEKLVRDAQGEADKLLTEKLAPLLGEVQKLAPGQQLRKSFEGRLRDIRERIIQGNYKELEAARDELAHPSQGIAGEIENFSTLVSKFAEVPEDKKAQVKQALDVASSLVDMEKILSDHGVQILPDPNRSYGIKSAVEKIDSATDSLKLSWKRKLMLSLPALLAVLVTYFFSLAVGWISLYVSSATFGSNPQDYISLFLWGGIIESVRGRVVTLTGLETVFKEKTTASIGG
ncbi:MAG: hypothetical protein JXA21_05170 [Anaerolineae bacterium]|nr:hypothetical protein [Anaerolineae bacterium]